MLRKSELKEIAQARIEDGEVLLHSERYDGAIYLCGYAVEIALKGRICETLGWDGYPSTRKEFANYQTFRTHNLDVLLRLSGSEHKVRTEHLAEWSAVAEWDPEIRYKPIGSATKKGAELMIESSKKLLSVL
ncbi:MAG: HEPN domain-containing protein [Phycisphaerales bacterium]|nr:MAG: HEPN domain-containing protein [Phycisphaerales bacterium]